MKPRPNSKAGRKRSAENLLRTLLRTPKTRSGLIAAVVGKDITSNFVYGWLSERTRDGTVTVFKGAGVMAYQITEHLVEEAAKPGQYPSWLDPRTLPRAVGRQLHIDGVLTVLKNKK